jgi:predicted TIM-barrel fold metal-dependent hydrolase
MLVDEFLGSINDVDSHEMIPTPLWGEYFGERCAQMAKNLQPTGYTNDLAIDLRVDDLELDRNNVNTVKGPHAPGAFDMARRTEVLDMLGIDRQLIFPSGPGLFGGILTSAPRELILAHFSKRFRVQPDNMRDAGLGLLKEHNDWCIRSTASSNGRLAPVAVVATTDINEAITEAERVIDGGVKAIMILPGIPPDGVSPCHPRIDAFWKVLTDSDTPLMIHIGGDLGIISNSTAWLDSPTLPKFGSSDELQLDTYSFCMVHIGAQNFLTAMILGGVFDRHPTLRVGMVEETGHWIGPFVENMEMWIDQTPNQVRGKLEMRPSEYVNRNVRASTFWWEPVDKYVERFGLEDVYCFATDYPHPEGGKDPLTIVSERLNFDPTMAKKFLVTNGSLLLP